MKKSLVALAALAVVGAASAQSTVTIYGRLDAGYSASTTTATTAAGVSSDAKDRGINNNGLATSYWGMKGSEDLGGGLRANFNLETSVGIDTGADGGRFDRISTLGASGNFGSVMVGRFYTPMFLTTLASDVFGAGGAYTVNLFTDGVRASDAFWYTTPNMGGFSATVMLGRSNTVTLASAAVAATPVSAAVAAVAAGDTTVNNTGLSATYAAGPLMVSAAYSKVEGTLAGVNGEITGSALTGTYNFGPAKLFAGHIRGKTTLNTTSAAATEQTETNLGVSVPMGAATFMAAYGRNTKDNIAAAGTVDGQTGSDFVIGVTYDLSKRTALYLKTGTYNKLDNTATLAGTKTNTTALGLRHLF
ncbi:porin [Rhodoferax sp.]|uniref:porin n=1 Tax=Rhodoferax sp. TaxID=50421 RepID=UPI001ECE21BB|nr:porin [Rhodoferax sp.]MBT9505922.1 porin [Rhodoferax sp.]